MKKIIGSVILGIVYTITGLVASLIVWSVVQNAILHFSIGWFLLSMFWCIVFISLIIYKYDTK